MQSILKVCDARLKIRWIEREEELSIVSIEVMFRERDEMRVLSGVVYKTRGSRTVWNIYVYGIG